MCIEFESLIIGMILWELVRGYLVKVIKPAMDKKKAEHNRKRMEKQAHRAETKETKEAKHSA